jgi:hypothetical protein
MTAHQDDVKQSWLLPNRLVQLLRLEGERPGAGEQPTIPGILLPLAFSPPRTGGPGLSAAAHSSPPFKTVSGAQTTAREWCHMTPEDGT